MAESTQLRLLFDIQMHYVKTWSTAGEYALAALLAMIFVYTLAFSNTNHTPFSSSILHSKHWWKARSEISGWMEQHQQYVHEAELASESLVCRKCIVRSLLDDLAVLALHQLILLAHQYTAPYICSSSFCCHCTLGWCVGLLAQRTVPLSFHGCYCLRLQLFVLAL